MAMDTKAKRAAALGYSLAFLLVLPPADGTISVLDAGHALSSYQFDLPAIVVVSATADYIVRIPADDVVVRIPSDDGVVRLP